MSSDHHAAVEKRVANAIARAALAGVVVHRCTDDRGHAVFIATRWALTKELRTADELEEWVGRVAGSRTA